MLLRLAFHDAGTFSLAEGNGGANGSIRLELQRPENQGAHLIMRRAASGPCTMLSPMHTCVGLKRGINVINDAMQQLQGTPAQGLSTADMIALAAAEAVRMTGGPAIRMPIGVLLSGQAMHSCCCRHASHAVCFPVQGG